MFKQFILCFFVSLILSIISILVFVFTDPKTQVENDFGDDFVVRDNSSTSNPRSETGINVSWYSYSFSPKLTIGYLQSMFQLKVFFTYGLLFDNVIAIWFYGLPTDSTDTRKKVPNI